MPHTLGRPGRLPPRLLPCLLLNPLLLLLLPGPLLPALATAEQCENNRPVIGVLTVPTGGSECATFRWSGKPKCPQPNGTDLGGSCFDSVYVKWLESAGARVAPILYDSSENELVEAFNSVNGILFTGGGEVLTDLTSPFMTAASTLFNLTVEANLRGDYVPLWGTCMGFQVLNVLAAENSSVLSLMAFDSEDLSIPLNKSEPQWSASRMVQALSESVRTWLTSEDITTNFHHDGVHPSAYARSSALRSFFKVLSTNVDRKGNPFVSTVEAKTFPIYGVQWHPERNQFEFWDKGDPINHTSHAVESMQSLAEFFVSEARGNCHIRAEDFEIPLIYNFTPQPLGSPFQSYYFAPKIDVEGSPQKIECS